MVNRGIVDVLCQTWQQTLEKRSKLNDDNADRTKSAPNLLILMSNFLKKLSIYRFLGTPKILRSLVAPILQIWGFMRNKS
uniref:Uncharacterized protein n=1 Tax=Romanomermis culicivorax TaxID=13658 RepID=A0A915IUS6_ROMCU